MTKVEVEESEYLELRAIRKAYQELKDDLREGKASDGFHTFSELYEHRMLLNAALFKMWDQDMAGTDAIRAVQKSWNHSDGQPCFGGGWFIVVAETKWGQISYHYEAEHWGLFDILAVDIPPEFDGHTARDVIGRLRSYLR